jgi:hypothetical protein
VTLDEWNDELLALSRRWEQLRRTRFPSGCAGTNIDGVELVLIDADIAMLIQSALTRAPLRPSAADTLARLADELRPVLPQLSGDATPYFTELVSLAEVAVSLSRAIPTPGR